MADLMQQAREQFEAWATSQQLPIKRHRWGEYKVDDTETAWEAWQAALRAAQEGPETHYHCADGIHGTLSRLRRYAKRGDNKNSLQGQTMEEAAAFIEHALAARPQGVSHG